jgi:hypothetical protein
MGWEPREVTRLVYDDAGVLVKLITEREPEYTKAERDLAIAYDAFEAELDENGIPLSVATDPANQFNFDVPLKPTTNWAAKKLGDVQDAYTKDHPEASLHGLMWGVSLKKN